MKLVWTQRARSDILEIGRYIAADNPGAARRWIARLKTRARSAAAMPHLGRMVPEWGDEAIREIIERNFRIVYRVEAHQIVVLTIFEAHRLLPSDPNVLV